MSLILVTLLLKLIFYPLSEASGKSMAKMRALQPRIKNIQEQYKDDKEKLGRATMELYQREKVNPVERLSADDRADPGVLRLLLGAGRERGDAPGAVCAVADQDLSSPDPYFHPADTHGRRDVHPAQAQSDLTGPGAGEGDDVHAHRHVGMFVFLPSGLVLYYVMNTVLGRRAAVEHQPPHAAAASAPTRRARLKAARLRMQPIAAASRHARER